MHVLRAEKGYPIIGQDTDGTVTPQDLGLGWAVSKKKPDFVGKRSFARASNTDPLRKQLVGLLPTDAADRAAGGLADRRVLRRTASCPPPPVPMLGHVTSSYRSAELGRPFALALVKGGRHAHRRHRARPGRRRPRPGRDHRPRSWSTRKEPVAMAEHPAPPPTRWRRRADASPRLPDGVGDHRGARRRDGRPPGAGAAPTGVLGVALPPEPNTWVARPAGYAVWLGPDEWL